MDLNIIKKIIRDLFRYDKIHYPQSDILTFACDNDRYIDYKNKKYSPLINTLEDDFAKNGLTSISITRVASTIKGSLSHGNVISPEGAFARALLFKKIKSCFIRKKYPYSKYEEKIWLNILRKTSVKFVIGINPSRELCSACHQNKIWVADIQHGVISDTHPWYGEQYRAKDNTQWLPDAFLCWDEGSSKVISKWAIQHNIDVLTIGNPWIERFIQQSPKDNIYQYLSSKLQVKKEFKPTILITLNWGNDNIPNKFIHPELEKTILSYIDKYNWVIRLHPNQIIGFASHEGPLFEKYFQSTYPKNKIDWKTATKMPLPLLLAQVNIHITWSSSVCIEASYFGIRSLVLDSQMQDGAERSDYYQHLEELGYIDKKKCIKSEIAEWIDRNQSIKKPPYQSYRKNYITLVNKLSKYYRT